MDVHFNAYKVKYALLDSYIRPVRNSQIIRRMNVFINIDDLLHNFHRPLVNNEFQAAGKDASKQFISNIFNLLGHYRYWCIKNHFECKVYGIYTSTLRSFKNNIYNADYRKKFKDINSEVNSQFYFINETIKNSLPLLQIISNYIPDVYLIDSKYMEPSIIAQYISENEFKADWNILISRDTYDLQYAYRNKWSVISPKGDNTTLVNQNGLWNYINNKEKVYKDEMELHYPYQLYILAKAIVGDSYRSIPRLRKIGWKTLFKFLDKVVYDNPDASITTLQTKLIEIVQGKHVTDLELSNNMYTLNIDLQIETMIEIDKTSIHMQLMDIPDYENLKTLNAQQFYNYPLNLQFLCNRASEDLFKSKGYNKTPFD